MILLAACAAPPTVPSEAFVLPEPSVPAWPDPGMLRDPPVVFPDGFGVHRVVVDPGHGTGTNQGAETCRCETEADHVLPTARALADGLEATGHFRVLVTRRDADGPSYASRLDAVARFGADALIGVHEDVRGDAATWRPEGGADCPRLDGSYGFAVLFSDRVDPGSVPAREALARAVGRRLAAAGLPAYGGAWYGDGYEADAVPGVFRDRRGLQMLRRPTVPAVIVETHHALDPAEHARWSEPGTLKAFVDAVAQALVDALRQPGP